MFTYKKDDHVVKKLFCPTKNISSADFKFLTKRRVDQESRENDNIKKRIKQDVLNSKNIILIIVVLLGVNFAYSQSNSMKFGVLGAAYGDYLIGFEQVIDVNHSMNFNVGYWNLNSGLINIGYLLRNEDKLWAKEGGSGWTGSLEQRNYFDFGRDTINRFYWGPYFRFWGNSLVLNDYIRNDFVTQQQLFEAETKFSGVGAGLQLGYQWMITDRLWLDFYFLGFGVERVNMSARYKAIGVDEFDYEIIKADVEGAFNGRAEFIKESVKVRTFDELLIVDLPFIIPSFRAGFNVAIILD